MRIESSVTSLSWIPSEAVKGLSKLGFTVGPLHYDEPLSDSFADLDELEEWRLADRFRFGNRLTAWIGTTAVSRRLIRGDQNRFSAAASSDPETTSAGSRVEATTSAMRRVLTFLKWRIGCSTQV